MKYTKRMIPFLLTMAMLLSGCESDDADSKTADNAAATTEIIQTTQAEASVTEQYEATTLPVEKDTEQTTTDAAPKLPKAAMIGGLIDGHEVEPVDAKQTTTLSKINTVKTTTAKQAAKRTPTTTAKQPTKQTPATAAAPKGHYETIHHDAVTEQVWVEDTAEYTIESKVHCKCGSTFTTVQEYFQHCTDETYGQSDEIYAQHNSYWWDDPIVVPATGHYETRVIKEAYDEQVWVND